VGDAAQVEDNFLLLLLMKVLGGPFELLAITADGDSSRDFQNHDLRLQLSGLNFEHRPILSPQLLGICARERNTKSGASSISGSQQHHSEDFGISPRIQSFETAMALADAVPFAAKLQTVLVSSGWEAYKGAIFSKWFCVVCPPGRFYGANSQGGDFVFSIS
jgi:hypothetical protein